VYSIIIIKLISSVSSVKLLCLPTYWQTPLLSQCLEKSCERCRGVVCAVWTSWLL